MFRLTAGETWLDGLDLMNVDTGELNYGTIVFINRHSLVLPIIGVGGGGVEWGVGGVHSLPSPLPLFSLSLD
jgi:hypothetical protein